MGLLVLHHSNDFKVLWRVFTFHPPNVFTFLVKCIFWSSQCSIYNTHAQQRFSFTPFPPPPPIHHHSKSCGQLTSTTWVWICGRQRTSTPLRRFSRFTTRLASSSHRHTFVSPATISLSLWITLPLIRWMVFFFFRLKPNQRCLRAKSSDWLLHSRGWKQEARLKVCGHQLMFLKKFLKKSSGYLKLENLK